MKSASIIAASLLGFAATSTVASAAAISMDYYDSDTRAGGLSTPVAFSNDGDGSLMYSTDTNPTGSQRKVAVTFYKPNGGTPIGASAMGTLGTINAMSFEYFMDSSTLAADSILAPAFRLKLSPLGTPDTTYVDLVWERTYNQPSGPAQTTPQNTWNQEDVTGQKFWQRSNGVNHDGLPENFRTLADWPGHIVTYNAPGVVLDANTPVYGVEISLGSGLPQNFKAYIDNVNIGFTGGDNFSANVPEPTGIAALAVTSLALVARRRSKVSA